MNNLSVIRVVPVLCVLAAGCTSDGALEPTPPGAGGGTIQISEPTGLVPAAAEQLGFLQDQPITFRVRNADVRIANNAVGGAPATTYELEVARDANFTNIVFSRTVQGGATETALTTTGKLAPGILYWRVRAAVGTTKGPYSAARQFELEPQGGHIVLDPTAHDGGYSEETMEEIIWGTADEYPELLEAEDNEHETELKAEELLLRIIWHLKLYGFDAARQKNPSGAISKDKFTIFIRGTWRTYDIFRLGSAHVDNEVVHPEDVGAPNPQPNDGIPD
jgi:hypothetical protein